MTTLATFAGPIQSVDPKTLYLPGVAIQLDQPEKGPSLSVGQWVFVQAAWQIAHSAAPAGQWLAVHLAVVEGHDSQPSVYATQLLQYSVNKCHINATNVNSSVDNSGHSVDNSVQVSSTPVVQAVSGAPAEVDPIPATKSPVFSSFRKPQATPPPRETGPRTPALRLGAAQPRPAGAVRRSIITQAVPHPNAQAQQPATPEAAAPVRAPEAAQMQERVEPVKASSAPAPFPAPRSTPAGTPAPAPAAPRKPFSAASRAVVSPTPSDDGWVPPQDMGAFAGRPAPGRVDRSAVRAETEAQRQAKLKAWCLDIGDEVNQDIPF